MDSIIPNNQLLKFKISLPKGVGLYSDQNKIYIKGNLGVLSIDKSKFYLKEVDLTKGKEKGPFTITEPLKKKKIKAICGTLSALFKKMIRGVSQGYRIKLELVGVGYRAFINDNQLIIKCGYSHDIKYDIPSDLVILCTDPSQISIIGIDAQRVAQIAANIRKFRKPEPYKGKGIRYYQENIKLKK